MIPPEVFKAVARLTARFFVPRFEARWRNKKLPMSK